MPWNGSYNRDGLSFDPIPEFGPLDSFINIFFMTSGRVLFAFPTNDPWYGPTTNSTVIHKLKGMNWGNTTMFRQSDPGSPLGCREQEQYCFVGTKGQQKCTTLDSPVEAERYLMRILDDGDEQWASWFLATSFTVEKQTIDPLENLGTHVLMARSKLNGPILGRLPDNQWQLEVQHWHATTMAYLQNLFIATVTGYGLAEEYQYLIEYPNITVEREICKTQVQAFKSPSQRCGCYLTGVRSTEDYRRWLHLDQYLGNQLRSCRRRPHHPTFHHH
jgi:hypothetical protein